MTRMEQLVMIGRRKLNDGITRFAKTDVSVCMNTGFVKA
jgi:hypothetical protein